MPESRISQVCRREVERMSRAVALIEEGHMTTAERRGGVMVDTTAETLDQYRIAIADLERFIENDA